MRKKARSINVQNHSGQFHTESANNDVPFFIVGDRVELLCDVKFGDINTKTKNPDAKLAFAGECAEVCGVRGTRLALSVGGEPFDWPIKLVKGISGAMQTQGDKSPHSKEDAPIVTNALLSDKWYTPPNIEDLVTHVLGVIDLDPCADDGKHIKAFHHYTAIDDGLSQEWHGRVFMNPPYSCPGKWIAKLQDEYESGRVTEAIALVSASTDTNWLSPLLDSQPVCFWKGRIKFLDINYQPKQSARQSHCFVYWGKNRELFKQVFQQFGVVKNDEKVLSNEIKFIKKGNKPMTNTAFQFSANQAIAEQIAQLQEQLNQLTTSLKPYQDCEQKAEDLRRQVAEYGHEMSVAGIPQEDILSWSRALYSAASATELDLGNAAAIASQNEEIARLKCELAHAQHERELATVERIETAALLQDTIAQRLQATTDLAHAIACIKQLEDKNIELIALLEHSDTTVNEALRKENISLIAKIQALKLVTEDMEVQLVEQQLMPEVEVLKQQIYESQLERDELLKSSAKAEARDKKESNPRELMTGDRVAVIDVGEEDLEYLIGNKGTVVGVNGNSAAVLFEKRMEFDEHEVVLDRRYLMLVSQPNSFIANIQTTSVANKITWENISEICGGSLAAFREMELSASTKIQKSFVHIDNLAKLMSEYIMKTGDITDFQWLDKIFITKVEALVEEKKSLSYHKGDWVQVIDTGVAWQVQTFDGQWLDVKKDGKRTSFHESEVKLVQVEVAA